MTRGGKRQGAGRKASTDGVMRTRAIRFSDVEWQHIEQRARELGVTVSEYIRTVLIKHSE